jgi:uncharacterized protein (DUF1501 family)
MKHTRREIMKVGLGALPLISIGSSMPLFVSRLAMAQTQPATQVSDDNVLVVVQLSGGNDGLNTVIPFANDAYLKSRPTLALKERLLKVNDELALNPGLEALKRRFDEGTLAIISGCGYPNPNRSHFESMDIWHTANPGGGTKGGWLGHYLDHALRGTSNPLAAVNIGTALPQALVNDAAPVPSIQSISDFSVQTDPGTPFDAELEQQIIRDLNAVKEASPAMQFLQRQSTNAIVASEQIRRLTEGYKPDASYPPGLGERLRLIAQIICGNFGTRVFYCEIGGFDTHSNQLAGHENLLKQVGDSIDAFLTDMNAKGYGRKVSVMCFSEFGRRVAQNDSNGTDHGTAGPMFVVGSAVKGGLHGAYPSLAPDDVADGDLKFTTDFRRVYATLLERWLNADSAAVLGNKFEPVEFL